jgi:hypothetical protein
MKGRSNKIKTIKSAPLGLKTLYYWKEWRWWIKIMIQDKVNPNNATESEGIDGEYGRCCTGQKEPARI